jgi:hypothetical protein
MPTESELSLLTWPFDKDLSDLDRYDDLLRKQSQFNGINVGVVFSYYQYPNTRFSLQDGIKDRPWVAVWQGLCELLFALRRPWENEDSDTSTLGEGSIVKWIWEYGKDDGNSHVVRDLNGNQTVLPLYSYYEEPDKYGWVLYSDLESLIAKGIAGLTTGPTGIFLGERVSRTDIDSQIFKAEGPESGSTEAQASVSGGISQPSTSTPIDIPVFPKWSDKIKEKFHRSVDKDMSEWDDSLDNWQIELQTALAN